MAYIGATPAFDSRIPDPGATGEVLKSDGTGTWTTADPAHLELPTPGAAGKVLSSDGSNWTSQKASDALKTDLPPSTAGKLLTSDGTNWTSAIAHIELPTPSTAGKLLTSDGTNWISQANIVPSPSTAGKLLTSDGTNWVSQSPELPAPSTTGKLLTSDGTNWTSQTPALPAVGSSGNLLTSDGTNWNSTAAPLELPAVGSSGNLLTSDGSNWTSSTPPLELPTPGTAGKLLTSDGTNWVSEVAAPAGGGMVEAIAEGALADGDTVILRTDGKVEAIDGSNLTATNFIGISDGAYADGATATIQGVGVIDDAQSGLTIGSTYYVQTDGSLDTEKGPLSVLAGRALSATNLMIFANRPTATAGGTVQAVANGAISSGQVVILQANGEVAAASNASVAYTAAANNNQSQTLGVRVPSPNYPVHAQSTFNPGQSDNPSSDTPSQKAWISWDPNDENKFIVAYDDITSPSRADGISVRIGSISGTTISFGTAVTVDGQYWASDHSPPVVEFHPSTAGLFACGYGGSGQGDIRLYFGTVSGTTITMANYWESSLSGTWLGRRGGSVAFSWCNFSSTNHFVFMFDFQGVTYSGPNTGKFARKNPKIVAGTVSDTGTGPSVTGGYGTDVHPYLEAADDLWWYGMAQVNSLRFDPHNANKFLVTGYKNSSATKSTPTVYICTTDGSTAITVGSEIDLSAGPGIKGIGEHHCEWNPGIANQIVFSGQQPMPSQAANITDPVFCVGTVSGTSVSWGALFRAVPGGPPVTSQPWEIFFGPNAAGGKFYGATTFMPSGGMVGYISVQAFSISGTTITSAGSPVTVAGHQWFDLFYNTTHIGVAFPWHIAVSASGNQFMVSHLSGTGSGNHTKFTSGTIGVAGVANLTATNFLGIAL